jgi:hypothetical protein
MANEAATNPGYKFKFYDRINPITGSKEYQTLMMAEVDGKPVTYRSGFQRSKQAAQDDVSRMIAGINATQSGSPSTIRQNYGSNKVTVGPSEGIKSVLETGGRLAAPETYKAQKSNEDGSITQTTYDQRGIRQADPITTYAANMLDPNYDPLLDAIVDPLTGMPVYDNLYSSAQYTQPQPMAQIQASPVASLMYPGGETSPGYVGTPVTSQGVASLRPGPLNFSYVPRRL